MRNFLVPEGLAAGFFRAVAAAAALAAPWALADPLAYVPLNGDNAVDVVDLGTGKIVTRIPVGSGPMGIAFNPVLSRAYVTNTDDGTVSTIDLATNTDLGETTVGSTPVGIAVSPNGRLVAVATMGASSSSQSSTIAILQPSGPKPVTVGSAPDAVVFNGAGTRLYVANYGSGTVTVVDTSTLLGIDTIPVGDHPTGLLINGAGTLLYVLQANGSFGPGQVSVVDLVAAKIVATIYLNAAPNWFAMNNAGTRIAVARPPTKSVSIIDTGTNTLLLDVEMPAGSAPTSVNYSPDDKLIYVVNDFSTEIVVLDAVTYAQQGTIALKGDGPTALGAFIPPPSYLGNVPGALSGLWWNPAESGWGVNFSQRNNNIFAAWFTYDANGNPTWYVASNCTMPASSSSCSGTLYSVHGPIVFGTTYDPSLRVVTSVGTLNVAFSGNNNASMSYTVNGISRTVAIQREIFSTDTNGPMVNFTDMWWNPAEPGYGMALTQQGLSIFVAWYVYDLVGNPTWFVAPDCVIPADGASCAGTAYKTTGPPLGTSFDPKVVTTSVAGYIRITFEDPDNGTFNYLSDTNFVTKPITRQVY